MNTFQYTRRLFREIEKYLKPLIVYFQSSEAIFLLFFANVIGVGAGFGAVIFRLLIDLFKNLFFGKGQHIFSFMGDYYVIILPAIGGIIVGLLIYFFARETKGHGVPEVMLALAVSGGKIRPRIAVMGTIISSICIGSGGSVGREGPIVQIGSSLGSTLGQLFHLSEDKKRMLIACGAAGGIAATFNAPLAGIFFGLEVILREYGTRYFSSVVLSAVTATVISRTFLGSEPAFAVPPYELASTWNILFYFILGLIAAFASLLYIKTLYKFEDIFDSIRIPPYVKPAIGGLLLGVVGFYFPQIFGVGYSIIEKTLNGQLGSMLVFGLFVFKILGTSLTLGSGGSGGVFSPSLFIGAMLGNSFGSFLHLIFPGMPISLGGFAMVGMGAVFAGAAQAPITAILVLFEMTGDYKIILPLMISCVISTLVVKKFSPDSIYTLKLTRRGIDILNIKKHDLMEKIHVSEAMFRNLITVTETMAVRDAGLLIKTSSHRGFPVLNETGQLKGIVTRQDINKAMNNDKEDNPVGEIMTRDLVLCYPEETIKIALEKMAERNIGRIPVVEHNDPEKIIGLITRKGIIAAINTGIKELEKESKSS